MPLSPLDHVKLPLNMSAALAKDLALTVTGHTKESDLVRYAALAFHYVSWTVQEDTSLRVYAGRLRALQADSNFHLLEIFTLPTAYALQGMQNGAPRLLVRDAQKAAMTWRRALESRNAQVLKAHARLMGLLDDLLDDEYELQERAVAALTAAITTHHPEMRLRDQLAGDSANAAPVRTNARRVQRGFGPSDEAALMEFNSPAEALHFVFSQLRGYRAAPTAPTAPAAAPADVDPTRPALKLFNPAEAVSLLQRMPASGPGEGNAQQRRLLDMLANDNGWRALTEVPEGQPLSELYERFPHFSEVLDYIAGSLALAACGEDGRPARVAPLLLRGLPGTGKTYFAQELARVLNTHFVERDLSVTSEAFVISGMDATWKNSKPGVVFEALVNGKTANPLICLNEVDKARATGTHNSPMAALYALLEPTSAEAFADEFAAVKLDASRVLWVLTANDGDIPEPILSRLEVFDIKPPTPEQCRAIAQSVWTTLCRKLMPKGHGFAEQLTEPLLGILSGMSPRVMRKALTAAASRAALDGRKTMIPADITDHQARYQDTGTRRSIGFCAQH